MYDWLSVQEGVRQMYDSGFLYRKEEGRRTTGFLYKGRQTYN